MINIDLDISIRSDKSLVWAFMSDVTKGLSMNRYHSRVITDTHKVSMGMEFLIAHKIFLNQDTMIAKVIEFSPPHEFTISEEPSDKTKIGFTHNCSYRLKKSGYGTKLSCQVTGTYGSMFLDLPFKPVLRVTIIEELLRIKLALESTQPKMDMQKHRLELV